MNSNQIYTRKILGLDKRVWFTMFSMIILCIGLLSYRLINKKECVPVTFTFKSMLHSKGNIFTVGERISFNSPSKDLTWDFDDNSKIQVGQFADHVYQTEGDYIVTVSSGLSCEPATRQITIIKPITAAKSTDVSNADAIEGPASAITGKNEYFTCKVPANFYEWSILTIPQSTVLGSTVNFSFPARGTYTIQVTLDNDLGKRYTKEVIVEDDKKKNADKAVSAPPKDIPRLIPLEPLPDPVIKEKEPEQKPAEAEAPVIKGPIFIADPTFTSYLQKVVAKELSVADFEKYGIVATTPVKVNGGMKSFAELCNELTGKKTKLLLWKKSVHLKSAVLHRTNKDITLIEVSYDYK